MKEPELPLCFQKPDLFFSLLEMVSKDQPSVFRLAEAIEKSFQVSNPWRQWISESIQLKTRLTTKQCPFPFWLMTRERFEMATHFTLAKFHASLVPADCQNVIDLTAGAGFDSLAFLNAGFSVTSWETDESAFLHLVANRLLWNLPSWSVRYGDSAEISFNHSDFLFVDPMRRSGSKRQAGYQPDPLQLNLRSNQPVLIKLSPLDDPSAWIKRGYRTIAASYDQECREVLIHRNLNPDIPTRSVWMDGFWYKEGGMLNLSSQAESDRESLYWPDPALLVSGLAEEVSEGLSLRPVQPGHYICTGSNRCVEPLFKRYYLIDNQNYKISELASVIGQLPKDRPVVFKKKYSRVNVDSLSETFRRPQADYSQKPAVIMVTDINGASVFWMCEPTESGQNSLISPR